MSSILATNLLKQKNDFKKFFYYICFLPSLIILYFTYDNYLELQAHIKIYKQKLTELHDKSYIDSNNYQIPVVHHENNLLPELLLTVTKNNFCLNSLIIADKNVTLEGQATSWYKIEQLLKTHFLHDYHVILHKWSRNILGVYDFKVKIARK